MKNHTKTFDEAIKTITQFRGKDYGHPLEDFERAQTIKAAVSICKNAPVRHALEMIGVKMARLAQTPDHMDSVIDIAGYARTIAMILEKQENEE
ncbi:MAG: hypothetical protein H8E94_06550 [Alphaproteobacteria bacterium]|nr:hypothetical protein [Alphaproteobacteria bacterium]